MKYAVSMSSSVNWSLIYVALSDVFKVSLNKIEVKSNYQTRGIQDAFVDVIAKSVSLKFDETVVYLAAEGNPLERSGNVKETAKFFVLGGTHYM